jgi:hypothetical protein
LSSSSLAPHCISSRCKHEDKIMCVSVLSSG